MKIKLILALLVMLVVALFSVQNAGVITVHFLHWHFVLSQALVILLSAFGGALFGIIIGATSTRKSRAPIRTPGAAREAAGIESAPDRSP